MSSNSIASMQTTWIQGLLQVCETEEGFDGAACKAQLVRTLSRQSAKSLRRWARSLDSLETADSEQARPIVQSILESNYSQSDDEEESTAESAGVEVKSLGRQYNVSANPTDTIRDVQVRLAQGYGVYGKLHSEETGAELDLDVAVARKTLLLKPEPLRLNLSGAACQNFCEKGNDFASVVEEVRATDEKTGAWTLSDLSSQLPRLFKMHSLTVSKSNCTEGDEGALVSLGAALAELNALRELEVGLPDCCAKPTCAESLGGGLQQLDKLEAVALKFPRWKAMQDEAVRSLAQGFKGKPALKSVTVDFEKCEMLTDGGVRHLCAGLRGTTLESVKINLADCDITDRAVGVLGATLARIRTLKQLDVDLENCENITENGMISMCEDLGGLKGLEEMILAAPEGELGDEVLEALAGAVRKMEKLTRVRLELTGMNDLTPIGLAELISALGECKQMRDIELVVGNMATDDTLKTLARAVRHLPKMVRLELSCAQSGDISDEGLTTLGDALAQQQGVAEIHLTFFRGACITDEGLRGLADGLTALPELRKVKVDCSSCVKVTDAGARALATAVTRAEELALVFSGTQVSNEHAVVRTAEAALACAQGAKRQKVSREEEEEFLRAIGEVPPPAA
mmetsp:Transcript_95/g.254  ORF Transcript_95/g.254 Transcript_95/m.254 type:complete len:629 (+) Transcript_95:80-1966(+)